MRYFTEFHLHKYNTTESGHSILHVIVVEKDGGYRCMNNITAQDLFDNLTYLDSDPEAGWFKDDDVGELIATYTIESHPEYFI